MILSNSAILKAIKSKRIIIDPKPQYLAGDPNNLFDSSSLNLRLGDTISLPNEKHPMAFDLRQPGIATLLTKIYERHSITLKGGFTLEPGTFALAQTFEKVTLPPKGKPCYAARIEGRSSFARCGLLVHFTAPTIHAGFSGRITLELKNLGSYPIVLFPKLLICQLIFETVEGNVMVAPSQFQNQTTPEGIGRKSSKQ